MEKIKQTLPHFVLPEVYGDSLSYYEVLTKLCSVTNALIDFVNLKWDENAQTVMIEYLTNSYSELIYDKDTKTLSFNFKEKK